MPGGPGVTEFRSETCRTVLLGFSQYRTIEEELVAAEPETSGPQPDGAKVEELEEEVDVRAAAVGWEIYYDNEAFALTLRGWWLCERGGGWLLRVPVHSCSGGTDMQQQVRVTSFEEVTVPEVILERIGLPKHAELSRKSPMKKIERLLAQAGVTPFARLHTDRRFCRVSLSSGASHLASESAEADVPSPASAIEAGMELAVAFDVVKFDAKYAENQTVADLVSSYGAAARTCLKAALVEFKPIANLSGGDDALRKWRADLDGILRARGLYQPVSTHLVCPKLHAYMHTLRPVHLATLRRMGAIPVEEAMEQWE